jgi:hypothetical protein
MFAFEWQDAFVGLLLVVASWCAFCVCLVFWQAARIAKRQRRAETVRKMLLGELKSAQCSGDELAAYRAERALMLQDSRLRHPTSWNER